MHDIPVTEQVTTSVFADDVSMYTVQESFETASEILQAAVEKFQQWCHKWGFEINPEKSSLMFFTRKRFFVPPTISYNGISIPIKTSHKFLGLVLDSPTLTWRHHLEKVKRSCASRLNLLKVLGNSKWGCSRRALTKFLYCMYQKCNRLWIPNIRINLSF